MRASMIALVICAAALSASCGLFRPDQSCHKTQDYESSGSIARLKVPAGLNAPDTRDALVVPPIGAPEAPRSQSDGCLDEPPRYRSDHAAQTDAQSESQKDNNMAGAPATGAPDLALNSSNRGAGWEFGLDAVYLGAADWSFEGGSSVSVSDDTALTLTFGYRLNSHLEVQGALDWQSAGYRATIASADVPLGASINVKGDYEAWTPRIGLNYNFLNRDITPYVTAGLGWSFIDSNIPNGQVSVGCWWDPWYGEICTSFRDTANFDVFTYQAGIGLRWDSPRGYGMRIGYEKHWLDFSKGTSAADLDQFRLGFIKRY